MQRGTYAGASFVYDVSTVLADDAGLTLSGGWNVDFSEQTRDASLTVLSGGGVRPVLFVDARRAGRMASVTLEFITVRDGYATARHGAGLLALAGAGSPGQHGLLSLTLRDCLFLDNHVQAAAPPLLSGGALFVEGTLLAERTDFVGNQSDYAGAAHVQIYDWGTPALHDHALPARFTDCTLRNNTNDGPNGPAVLRVVGNALTMEGCTVESTTGLSAGVTETIVAYEGPVRLSGCRFRGNIVEKWASAIDLLGAPAEIVNCLFEGNWAGHGGGVEGDGLITGWNYDYAGGVTPAEHVAVTNCTFVDNRGRNGAYSVLELQWPQTASFSNCVFVGNESPAVYPGSGATLAYSRIEGTPAAQGFADAGNNTAAEPSFQAGDPDYKLSWDSPLIDAGANWLVPGWVDFDFKGAVRIFAVEDRNVPTVDLGWDEYVDWTLELTAPAAGTAWLNDGTAKTIAWTCTNIGSNVSLTLWQGPPGAAVKVRDIATVACAGGSYAWTIPADLPDGLDYAVAVSPTLYPAIERSVAPLAIQRLRLGAPNGGQSLVQGSTCRITWESGPLPLSAIRIELYNGAALARVVSTGTANTGSYSWQVPYAVAPGSAYRIRISTTAPHGAEDWSDASFRVLPALTLTAPNGGQRIRRGTQCRIAWAYRNKPGGLVRLDLYRGGTLNRTIALKAPIGAAGKGSYLWTVPASQPPGAAYTVRVRSATYPSCFDFGNKPFTITR